MVEAKAKMAKKDKKGELALFPFCNLLNLAGTLTFIGARRGNALLYLNAAETFFGRGDVRAEAEEALRVGA